MMNDIVCLNWFELWLVERSECRATLAGTAALGSVVQN